MSHKKFYDARSNARRRGLDFQLTREEYSALVTAPCVYGTDVANGIDRKDSAQPYTLSNCLPCCYRHNVIKGGTFTYEEMLTIVKSCPSAVACGGIPKRTRLGKSWKSLAKQGRSAEKTSSQAKAWEERQRRTLCASIPTVTSRG